ncbi:hypothetical protein L1987_00213 [Smallanthus sonchifolius]|uniref:Uncharacterized protein n=1 Tax=Smallanthus sonchifolius TaxID=185202 RepID=A0ACB9K1K5_9ASTR|nr:hypothetical protein L1987_00213 [Smallanthus sonchifolius]
MTCIRHTIHYYGSSRNRTGVFFADVGRFALDFHHGFVIQYGCNRDIELGICHLFILILFTLPKFIDIVVSRAPFYMNVSCRFANLSWKHQASGGGGVAVAAIGCGIEPAAVAAVESKKE